MADDSQEKAPPTEPETDGDDTAIDRPSLNRRSVLIGTAATVGGVGGLSRITGGQSDAVDIVELGADPTGNDPIDDYLTSALDQYDTVTFPPGEYRVSGTIETDQDGWTMTGENATLIMESGGLRLGGDGWTFNGFEIDYSEQSSFGTVFPGGLGGGTNWVFSNVVFRGTRSPSTKNTLISPRIPSGGVGKLHAVYAHEGGADGTEDGKPKLMWTRDMMGRSSSSVSGPSIGRRTPSISPTWTVR